MCGFKSRSRQLKKGKIRWIFPFFLHVLNTGRHTFVKAYIIMDHGGGMALDLSGLNPCQFDAATHEKKDHCLILAGAGSGKTRVLTYRIAWLVETCGVNPWRILAFTFTNKAANEMKVRTEQLLGEDTGVRLMTFHKFGLLFLKRYASRIGLTSDFSVFDTGQQETLVKRIFEERGLKSQLAHPDVWIPRRLSRKIAYYKDTGKTPDDVMQEAMMPENSKSRGDYEVLAQLYRLYDQGLRENNAIDFADMLKCTYKILKEHEDIREAFQTHYLYILVDEFQDTNRFQIEILKLLQGPETQITAVGDDDQSIYGWRGADNTAILRFEHLFGKSSVYKLEQNYRSTKPILACASTLISHNIDRKEKTLWTSTEGGEPVHCFKAETMKSEASAVVERILRLKKREHLKWQDFAILFRVNSRSSLYEQACSFKNVPYQIVGGTGFYEREEIADLLSYLRVLVNPLDRISLARIINRPARHIGDKSVEKLLGLLKVKEDFGTPREACLEALLSDIVAKKCIVPRGGAKFVEGCASFLKLLRRVDDWRTTPPKLTLLAILQETNYRDYLKKQCDAKAQEYSEALERVDFLLTLLDEHQREKPNDLAGFLEEISIIHPEDHHDNDAVKLMTLHSSKGLEFNTVFIVGASERGLPLASRDGSDNMEEERRLMYVGMTRARQRLYISYASFVAGQGNEFYDVAPSPFYQEMCPKNGACMEWERQSVDLLERRASSSFGNKARASLAWTTHKSKMIKNDDVACYDIPAAAFEEPSVQVKQTRNTDAFGQNHPGEYESREASNVVVTKARSKQGTELRVGSVVFHSVHGRGCVRELSGAGRDIKAVVAFDTAGQRTIVARFLMTESDRI